MDTKQALEVLDSVVGRIGDDTQIEQVTTDLIAVKDHLLGVDAVIDQLNEDVAKLNEKNRGLLQSNNTLYRQIGHQQDVMKKANEEVSSVEAITALF